MSEQVFKKDTSGVKIEIDESRTFLGVTSPEDFLNRVFITRKGASILTKTEKSYIMSHKMSKEGAMILARKVFYRLLVR